MISPFPAQESTPVHALSNAIADSQRQAAQLHFAFGNELIIDFFAGGGGASTAIEQAFGRPVDIAVNHSKVAIAMHTANHPHAKHFCEDVFAVDPYIECRRQVGLFHASPDCTHHSQASGGQPRSKAIRALSWVVLKWAARARPRVISLENVFQICAWGALKAKRDPATGRVVRTDRTVAAPGERTPLEQQYLVPDPKRKGQTWNQFVAALRGLGYAVQWKKLKASDFGAPTSRERLFMVARCDGQPIRWPKPTHGVGRGLKPYVSAASCIDFNIPCPSIFDRKRPLVLATNRRIATGLKRYVLDAQEPYIVAMTHHGGDRVHSACEPLRTITAAHRGELAVAVPYLVPRYGERPGQEPRTLAVDAPLPTIVPTDNGAAIVTAFLEQANTGVVGHHATEPLSTIVGRGSTQRLVTANLATLRNHCVGTAMNEPISTIAAAGQHHAVIQYTLSPAAEEGALRVAAFLMSYNGQFSDLPDPASCTREFLLALVTVTIKGIPYVIVDIGLRMLTPRELFLCQGFPADYIIDRDATGRALTKTEQARLVGNSVSPPPMRALVECNVGELVRAERLMAGDSWQRTRIGQTAELVAA